jgi:hypothetical protein
MNSRFFKTTVVAGMAAVLLFLACGKKSDDTNNNVGNNSPCLVNPMTLTASVGPATLGQSNGTINATASGGGSGITYSIDGSTYQNTGVFANLAVGAYTVSARSTQGCTASLRVTVTASNPCSGVTIVVSTTPSGTTGGQANGSIAASASGGSSPYTFSKDGGVSFQSSGTFNGLAAGNYTIIAMDANGCSGTSAVVAVP